MKKTIVFILLVITFLYLIPFYKYVKGELTIGYISSSIIVNSRVDKNQSDSLKALILFDYVVSRLKYPTKNHLPIDDNCFQILKYQFASCDQQSNVLIYLSSIAKMEGRLLFLYGSDSISHHSVAELKIGNSYRVFCPYFKKVFYNRKKNLATMTEIQHKNLIDQNITIPPKVYLTQSEYYQLYDTLFSYKVFKDNREKLSKKEKGNRFYFDVWYSIVGDLGMKPLFSFICYYSKYTSKEKEILKNLIFSE